MRRRNMYYATGQPGWMRFGYSPGWAGRGAGGGRGPCAQFLMTGQWPGPAAAMQGMTAAQMPQAAPTQRLAFLQAQLGMLEQQMAAIRDQIAAVESGE